MISCIKHRAAPKKEEKVNVLREKKYTIPKSLTYGTLTAVVSSKPLWK